MRARTSRPQLGDERRARRVNRLTAAAIAAFVAAATGGPAAATFTAAAPARTAVPVLPSPRLAWSASPAGPVESVADIADAIGATGYWNQGYTGRGVDVAVIDSGVTPVAGLADPTKVVYGPDLSDTAGDADLAGLDGFGHGTHMAGIIAGHDDATGFTGVAPDARIVSIKVADDDGTTNVLRVVQAIDWVVAHRQDGTVDIRVLNLSLGDTNAKSYTKDVLAAAVERAWDAGIVVVAAAGNNGQSTKALNDPAFDPYVLAVGAVDQNGTTDMKDDEVADFSSRGSKTRDPDVVAPGVRIQSLRVPGSAIDQQAPSADDSPYVNGSGTSQAAAAVSGAVALVLQAHPGYTPDQVKVALMATAVQVKGSDGAEQGRGEVHLVTYPSDFRVRGQSWKQAKAPDIGTLATDAADVTTVGGDAALKGVRWNGVRWNGVRWNGVRWNGVRWNGVRWNGNGWS